MQSKVSGPVVDHQAERSGVDDPRYSRCTKCLILLLAVLAGRELGVADLLGLL